MSRRRSAEQQHAADEHAQANIVARDRSHAHHGAEQRDPGEHLLGRAKPRRARAPRPRAGEQQHAAGEHRSEQLERAGATSLHALMLPA
jgi:hypothetical protein